MKSIIYKGFLFASMFAIVGLASCREEQTEEEKIIEEMKNEGAEIERSSDDGDVKIKMETDEKEVKIKKDADGDTKIKVDTDGN